LKVGALLPFVVGGAGLLVGLLPLWLLLFAFAIGT
jgi:hypothetical protein